MSRRPLRLMFLSRHCLLDRTSGAALTCIELMRRAARRGLPTRVVTGTVLDVNPPRAPEESDVQGWGAVTKEQFGEHELWRVDYDGVENVLLRTENTGGRRLTDAETDALETLWEREVEAFRPDVVLMYCGFRPERRMLARLGERGVKRVLHLANENYKNAAVFHEVDLIETTSTFLHDFYQKIDGIDPWVGAPVIDTAQYVASRHEPRYVTFINPAPSKGAGLFYQIAGLAALQAPQAEFLVVESRGHARGLRENNGLDLEALPNVTVWPQQADMRRVYQKTRILLMPSFWTECFGRVVVEAGWNGIPTLGARQGGIPEAMNGSGRLLEVPARCRQKHTAMPTPAEAQPWVDAIAHWLADPEAYAAAARRARIAAAAFDPDRVVSAILERFNALTEGFDIGTPAPRAETGEGGPATVLHLDTARDGLGVLHPFLVDAPARVIRLGAGAGPDAEPPHRLVEAIADGTVRAVQAEHVLDGLSPDLAIAAMRALARVLDDEGYALLAVREGDPFDRQQMKQATDRAGFQQVAMSDASGPMFRCVLSKVRRSQDGWQQLRELFLPPRKAAAAR